MAIQINKTQLKKLNKLAEGGEATIYLYDKNTVLKIFKDPKVFRIKQQKVEAMLGKKSIVADGLVVMPLDIVTMNGSFVGYQMTVLGSAEPLHSFTKARFVRDQGFTNLDALQIATKLSHAVDGVHAAGCIIGDVSDNNFMASLDNGHKIYLIDTDSWGIDGLDPDAYTETFTPPEAYNKSGHMRLTEATDKFGFAILTFNILTRIHPFGGTYKKNPNMNTVDRIKKKISLLGQHDIVYNESLFNWSWMSPDLLEVLKETFEGDKRRSITGELDDQLAHSKYCKAHNLYFYDRYAACPLCAGVAKLKKTPVVTVVATATGPKVRVVFADPSVNLMLGADAYFDKSGNIVHIATKKALPRISGAKMYFASGGKYLVSFTKFGLLIQSIKDGEKVSELDRMTSSSFAVEGANVLYVDRADQLHKLLLSAVGIQDKVLFQASNPLLALNELGEHFVINRYLDRIAINYAGRSVEMTNVPSFKEYAIKYDAAAQTWLLIYEKPNGSFRTMVFGANGVEYDDDIVRYNATPLSNVCYYNGTVFDPGIKSFTGTNLKKGTSKVFQCDKVDETCRLKFEDGGFTIISDTTIYRFG